MAFIPEGIVVQSVCRYGGRESPRECQGTRRRAGGWQVPESLAVQLVALVDGGPIDTIHTLAQQAGLSQAYCDRLEKTRRVVPQMQATIEYGLVV
jgi:hypothetical protein